MTTVRLARNNQSQQWGFRIHGGRDFNQPLIVLKVTGGSIAASSGLTPGDTLLKINNTETGSLNHKDAQDLIKNAGNNVDFVVIKAGQQQSPWKPAVQVLNNPEPSGEVTKTSLARNQNQAHNFNSKINNQPKPFSVQSGAGQVLVNKQFNTPINIYSEQSIAETLSAQAEVLAGGAIGVNFKKNEKKYNYENSEVYKMLQEVENEQPGYSEGDINNSPALNRIVNQPIETKPLVNLRPVQQQARPQQPLQPQQQQVQQIPVQLPSNQLPTQQVTAPVTNPQPVLPPGSNICAECERLIVGVFVRIKEKNLHVDCFKCSTCGQSLKNIGYYNINNKLYCDIHAKTVARQQTEPSSSFSPKLPHQPAGLPIQNVPSSTTPTKPFSYTQLPQQPFQPLSPSIDSYAAKVAPLPFHHSPSGGITHVPAPKSPQIQPLLPIQQPFSAGSQTQTQQFNQSSSTFESFQKTSFVSESSSSSAGSKVVWPPAGGLPALAQAPGGQLQGGQVPQQAPQAPAQSSPQQGQGQGSPSKFKQQHVPYQPLSTLLAPAGRQQQFQSVQAPSQNQVSAPSFTPQPSQAPSQAPSFTPSQQPIQQPSQGPIAFTPLPTGFKPSQAPSFTPQPSSQAPSFKPSASGGGLGGGGIGPGGGAGKSTSSNILANRIGRGILNQPGGHSRVAICGACQKQIRGPFVSAGQKFYCPDHFKCGNQTCGRDLMEIGFVEEKSNLYCEFCWEQHIAPICGKCQKRIKNECLKAIGQDFHPNCFACKHCGKLFGKESFFLEDGFPYCQADWNEMFTTKCHGCGFPIEAGDRWVEAMNNNYHSQCFNCTACKKNLEGQSFFAKAGRPFCKSHAR